MLISRKILLVGIAPSRTGDPTRPLVGRGSGDRLMRLAGLTRREYIRAFDRLNLFDTWPGSSGKGDHVPGIRQRRAAAARVWAMAEGRSVVFLGRAVAEAFGFVGPACRMVRPFGSFAAAARVPHPSPISRALNDAKERRRLARFLRRALRA